MEGSTTLCGICQSLIIDDSSHDGIINPTEDDVQRLLFVGLPPDIYVGHELSSKDVKFGIKRLPVPYAISDVFPDLPCLSDSANGGCTFCAALKSTLQNYVVVQRQTQYAISITQAEYEWEVKVEDSDEDDWQQNLVLERLSFWVELNYDIRFQLWFKISCPPGPCATWLNIKRRPLLDYAFWDQGDRMLSSWVTENVGRTKHPGDGKLPTRLLDVGSPHGNEPMRIVVTDQHPETFGSLAEQPPEYLILSYCWGDANKMPLQTFATTKDTFSQYCQQIPIEKLPDTCRDAVHVTRALGFRYLWIDAFCIIQDDKADWEMESLRMADAYGNAYLTIVPLRSTSSHDGFLPKTPTGARIPFSSNINSGLRGEYSVHPLRPGSKAPRHEVLEMYKQETGCSKWRTRGWTFQEALMSQRKLQFGAESVFLEDSIFITDDNGGPGVGYLDTQRTDSYLNLRDRDDGEKSFPTQYWYRIVNAYARRQFSFPNDRLPAISSLAQAINGRLQDEYVAGVFKSDLARGLMWETEQKAKGFTAHVKASLFGENYLAPSWSWASSNGSAKYTPMATLKNSVEEVHCGINASADVDGKNVFGRINFAHLVVTSRPYHSDSMRLRREEDREDGWKLTDGTGFQAQVSLDWDLPLYEEDSELRISDLSQHERHYGPLRAMHLIPLLVSSPGIFKESQGFSDRLYGLVAAPALDWGTSLWIRIGIFQAYEREDCLKARNHFAQLEEKTFRII